MASESQKPENMSDEELKVRLEKTARNPEFVNKHENLLAYGAAVVVVGLVAIITLTAGTGIGIVGALAASALVVGGAAAVGIKCWRWKDEHEALSAEDQKRAPARAAEKKAMATRLKEAFIAAITGGTTKEIEVKKPLQLKKPQNTPSNAA